MPDTFSHIAIPYLFRNKHFNPVLYTALLLGVVLPDYLRELFILILPQKWFGFTLAFHSISGSLFISMFISAFFKNRQRVNVFLGFLAGMLLHQLFDISQQYPCDTHIYPLFPLKTSFNLNLIPESAWIYIFWSSAALLTISGGYRLLRYYYKKRVKEARR